MTAGSAPAPFGDPPPPDATRHSTAGRTMVDSRVYGQALRRAQAAEADLCLAYLRAGMAEAVAAKALQEVDRREERIAELIDGELERLDPDFADWTPLPESPVAHAACGEAVDLACAAPPAARAALTFDALRRANVDRLPQFRDRQGRLAHSAPDGSDWSLADWLVALAGEVGEAANLAKKVRRGDLTLDEARGDFADELADIACYLDLVALRARIDLGEAVRAKFNAVSDRVGSTVRL